MSNQEFMEFKMKRVFFLFIILVNLVTLLYADTWVNGKKYLSQSQGMCDQAMGFALQNINIAISYAQALEFDKAKFELDKANDGLIRARGICGNRVYYIGQIQKALDKLPQIRQQIDEKEQQFYKDASTLSDAAKEEEEAKVKAFQKENPDWETKVFDTKSKVELMAEEVKKLNTHAIVKKVSNRELLKGKQAIANKICEIIYEIAGEAMYSRQTVGLTNIPEMITNKKAKKLLGKNSEGVANLIVNEVNQIEVAAQNEDEAQSIASQFAEYKYQDCMKAFKLLEKNESK